MRIRIARVGPDLITLDDVLAARSRLHGVAQLTPVETSRAVSSAAGFETLLKCEHLQRTGSFKIRGAYNRIAQLGEDERRHGVVCASAGNHAQGVALSATLLGVSSTVFMPVSAPLPKVEATRSYGADVILAGEDFDEAFEASQKWAAEREAVFVHPFDHPDVIAGQGTLGLEILDQVPEAATVVVPMGGGGLISGVAVAVKAHSPDTRIIGVEASGAAAFPTSLAAGRPVPLETVTTIADGIAVKTPGELTLAHVAEYVDDVVTVTEEEIARAVLLLVERAKQVVEPSGAAGLAAVLSSAGLYSEPTVVVLCGGNVDPLLLNRIIQSGMFEEGRYVMLRTRVIDRPGGLAALLGILADAGANIVAVEHHRLGTRLGVQEVEVALEIETRGTQHIRDVIDTLRRNGYPVS
ncbi:MAG: threonine ammonia-lyase [Nitriliruptorales bacterium]|nr:threonine ammonia-lyase [Nitriliruptorales bacterium]